MSDAAAHPLSLRPARRIADNDRFHLRFGEFPAVQRAACRAALLGRIGLQPMRQLSLNALEHPHCPAALQMASILEPLKALVSFDRVGVTVLQAERTVYAETDAQHAFSSVLGLIMATAGCPWTDHLRPMARFHLPFASEIETVYRGIGMFLLAREITGPRRAPWLRGPRGPLQEFARGESRYVAPVGRRHTHRSCAQCDRAARFIYDAVACGDRALAR